MSMKNWSEQHIELDGENGKVLKTNVFVDKNAYTFKVIPGQNKLILERIIGGDSWNPKTTPIQVFDLNNTTCIEQINNDKSVFFIAYELRDSDNKSITVYEDLTKYWEPFKQIARFENFDDYELINGRTFIIWEKSGNKFLHNIALDKRVDFDEDTKIWIDKEIIDLIDPRYHNTVLVRQKMESLTDFSYDYVTYGIDLTDFDIVTSIWSEEQRRYIKKYNSKERKKIYEETERDPKYFSPDDLIMLSEVKRYLDELYWQGIFTICRDQEKTIIRHSCTGNEINEEHVKKLKRQYQYDNFKPKRIIL